MRILLFATTYHTSALNSWHVFTVLLTSHHTRSTRLLPYYFAIDSFAFFREKCLNMMDTAQVTCGLSKGPCRHKETWWWNEEVVEARGLNREDAMDRCRWRKQIGILDDHDGCEWVNVSSGTGSPGLSRTKSKQP